MTGRRPASATESAGVTQSGRPPRTISRPQGTTSRLPRCVAILTATLMAARDWAESVLSIDRGIPTRTASTRCSPISESICAGEGPSGPCSSTVRGTANVSSALLSAAPVRLSPGSRQSQRMPMYQATLQQPSPLQQGHRRACSHPCPQPEPSLACHPHHHRQLGQHVVQSCRHAHHARRVPATP